uniref:Uncharacterized protein n=1 Tax=Globodera pallida TaxID=36090 RepID=A0A183CTW8_GLOPA
MGTAQSGQSSARKVSSTQLINGKCPAATDCKSECADDDKAEDSSITVWEFVAQHSFCTFTLGNMATTDPARRFPCNIRPVGKRRDGTN